MDILGGIMIVLDTQDQEGPAPPEGFILMETGDFILQEDGSLIGLEDS